MKDKIKEMVIINQHILSIKHIYMLIRYFIICQMVISRHLLCINLKDQSNREDNESFYGLNVEDLE